MALPDPVVPDPQQQRNNASLDLRLRKLEQGNTGTTFPTSPTDGQIFIYNADTTNGVKWMFQYRSASASTYKWEFIGGAPLVAYGDGAGYASSGGSTAWFAGSQGDLTAPLAGDYDLGFSAGFNRSDASATVCYVGVRLGSTDPTLTGKLVAGTHWHSPFSATSQELTVHKTARSVGLTATQAVALRFRCDSQPMNINSPYLSLIPIRVSG